MRSNTLTRVSNNPGAVQAVHALLHEPALPAPHRGLGETMKEAQVLVERWRRKYNQRRLHIRRQRSDSLEPRPGPAPLGWASGGPRANSGNGLVEGGWSLKLPQPGAITVRRIPYLYLLRTV